MSLIFDKLDEHANNIKKILNTHAFLSDETHPFDWENKVYVNAYVRRAHLDIIDLRDTKKLYMMHLCVFPQVWDSTPIYGFDLIAGPNKVTGAFHDFSPVTEEHPYSTWFANKTQNYIWTKKRKLPEWAEAIFSDNMVAASNIQSIIELDSFLELSYDSLKYYMDNLYLNQQQIPYSEKVLDSTYKEMQNFYCFNQKQNPHTPRVLESLGFDPDTIQKFISTCLFPEI